MFEIFLTSWKRRQRVTYCYFFLYNCRYGTNGLCWIKVVLFVNVFSCIFYCIYVFIFHTETNNNMLHKIFVLQSCPLFANFLTTIWSDCSISSKSTNISWWRFWCLLYVEPNWFGLDIITFIRKHMERLVLWFGYLW